jgi:NAD+ diphosphatase
MFPSMKPLAYIGNPLDRRANERGDATWLDEQRRSPKLRMVHINGDKTIVANGKLVTDVAANGETVFLGIDDSGAPWFACRSDHAEDLRDLRSLALEATLPPDQIGILAQARSLVHWHERRTFCSNCGSRIVSADAGYRRHCPSCNMDHFPRTDPVIIIVARHGGRILLGRQSSWAPGMYSALAGFVEPGETIEAAARREVMEESGVRLGQISYVASQPWPFPANLMIGLIGEAISEEIVVDAKELEDARWFPAEEAQKMVDRTHPQGLWATNPMAIAHLLVRTALQAS